jgi:hypothetical protein
MKIGATDRSRMRLQTRRRPELEPLEGRALLTGSGLTSISFTASLPPDLITNQPRPISLPQFDPALGALVEATLTVAGRIDTTVDITSTGPTAENVTATTTGGFAFSGPGFGTIQVGPEIRSETRTVPPGGTLAFDVVVGPLPETISLATSQLAAYTGTGTVGFSFDPRATTSTTGSGNITTSTITNALASIGITYHYRQLSECFAVTVNVAGAHAQPTPITLTIGVALDPAQATNPANYVLFSLGDDNRPGTADDIPIAIRSIRYDTTNGTVTILPTRHLHPRATFELDVNRAIAGPNNTLRNPDGTCGDLSVRINRGESLTVVDADGDVARLSVSHGGYLTAVRSPGQGLGTVTVRKAVPGRRNPYRPLNPIFDTLVGAVKRGPRGDGIVPIDLLVGGDQVWLALPPSIPVRDQVNPPGGPPPVLSVPSRRGLA